MRHEVNTTVQEFCPDSSQTVSFLSPQNKRHQSAASRSLSYCSRLYSNFTRVNWPNLKQWALIQWKNTEGGVWNNWLTHYTKMKFFNITSKWKTQGFPQQSKNKMTDLFPLVLNFFWESEVSPSNILISMNRQLPVSQVLYLSDLFSLHYITLWEHKVLRIWEKASWYDTGQGGAQLVITADYVEEKEGCLMLPSILLRCKTVAESYSHSSVPCPVWYATIFPSHSKQEAPSWLGRKAAGSAEFKSCFSAFPRSHAAEVLLEYGNTHFLQVKRNTSVHLASLLNYSKVTVFSKKA